MNALRIQKASRTSECSLLVSYRSPNHVDQNMCSAFGFMVAIWFFKAV